MGRIIKSWGVLTPRTDIKLPDSVLQLEWLESNLIRKRPRSERYNVDDGIPLEVGIQEMSRLAIGLSGVLEGTPITIYGVRDFYAGNDRSDLNTRERMIARASEEQVSHGSYITAEKRHLKHREGWWSTGLGKIEVTTLGDKQPFDETIKLAEHDEVVDDDDLQTLNAILRRPTLEEQLDKLKKQYQDGKYQAKDEEDLMGRIADLEAQIEATPNIGWNVPRP